MNKLLVLSNVSIFVIWALSQYILVPYIIHLLALVLCILYSACHGSLILLEEQALARGEVDPNQSKEDQDQSSPPPVSETLKKEDAMQFPIIGSLSLFSLYAAFKYFDKDLVNMILGGYFTLIGCVAITGTMSPVLSLLKGPFTSIKVSKTIKVNHPLPAFIGGESPWDLSFSFTLADMVAFIGSCIFSWFYIKKKHWVLNNVIGICFCLRGIERLSLGTYKIGAILLIGLFFYDIFWVFGTDVMVTVAKSVEGPIKILFPRSLVPNESGKIELSLLGLGDIVIPGFFLGLLLRFDAHNANIKYFPLDIHTSFPKPYFHSALFGYMLGMGTTMFVMIYFQAAQPALLYLVPACLGSSMLTAAVRGEMTKLFAYSEETEEEETVESKKKD